MAMTKLTNLMNPEVMGDWVSEHLEKEMKFSPLCRVDFTLAGRAGDTVTVRNTPTSATPVRWRKGTRLPSAS